jgi:oligosaccharide repeat unit polymerase
LAGAPLPVAGGLILAVAVTAGILLAAGVPAAFALWGVCALATLPIAVWGLARHRFLEPLPVLAATCALLFVVRPLQLFIEWRDLYSYFPPVDPIRRLVLLEGQEIALFVGERVEEPLETAFARALGACALFLVTLLLGYRLPLGARVARYVGGLRGRRGPMNLTPAIGVSLTIGLIANATIIARAGGPAASLETASDQTALSESFVLFVLAGFAVAGVIVWTAWRRPRGRLEWSGFLLSVLAVCGFSIVAGSRGRVFMALIALAVIVHYLWRPWRRRELVLGAVVLLAFASSFVVFREVADDGSLRRAAEEAPRYALNTRVLLNDVTGFDHVLYATTLYGRERRHERGGFLLGGARSFVPSAIDPSKPDGGDIVFRRAVWGEEQGAGRPPTAVGDLFIDFGFPGVALGAFLIGILARSLLGLLGGPPVGAQYRVALYAILLVMLYELVADTFSLALGYGLTLAVPFLVVVHVFTRIPWKRASLMGEGAA